MAKKYTKQARRFAKKIEEVFGESGREVTELINLRQEERFLHDRQEEIKSMIREKSYEIEHKHSLKFLELHCIITHFEKKDFEKYVKHYQKEFKKSKKK